MRIEFNQRCDDNPVKFLKTAAQPGQTGMDTAPPELVSASEAKPHVVPK
jgi:hypothetical protein